MAAALVQSCSRVQLICYLLTHLAYPGSKFMCFAPLVTSRTPVPGSWLMWSAPFLAPCVLVQAGSMGHVWGLTLVLTFTIRSAQLSPA